MFRSARVKLTAWYLLIIMVITVLFSLLAYRGLTAELRRGLRVQVLRDAPRPDWPRGFSQAAPFSPDLPPRATAFDSQAFEDARRRLALQLVYINLGVLALAGMAGYFLAGRTLRPIEGMLDEQKRFIADASHELRTPLTAMRAETEVAFRDKNFDVESAKELLQSNLEEIDKLQLLSDYLLNLSHYQQENPGREFAAVNLPEIVDEARRSVKPLAQQKNIEIECALDDIALEADGPSLTKLFVILLDNAIKYSPEDTRVELSAAAKKGRAVIAVHDNGIGIRAGDLPHIFSRFYRADASRTKTRVPGYGLGLSIAKSIVDLHNGKVDVVSEPGKGTTFTVALPLKRQRKFL